MGQVALGFRSLLVKLTIFFVMAALLAWALGGTLWPRAETVDMEAVRFDGKSWFWRLAVGGGDVAPVRWTLMERAAGGEATPCDARFWAEVAGPVVADGALYVAGRTAAGTWSLERIDPKASAAPVRETLSLPDRLAVERQLARLEEGLPLQSAAEVARQRPAVLDPDAEHTASP